MGEHRTAWHYYLELLLQEKAPSNFEIRAEEPVTHALQHIDWLILRRLVGPSPPTPGETLVELWPMLPAVSIVEFKSLSKGYRPRDLHRLIGYGHQYFSVNLTEVEARADLALVLMVAERNRTLDRDLADLGLRERREREGYTHLDGLAFPTLLVDLTTVARRTSEDLIALFARDPSARAAAKDWWYDHHGTVRKSTMDPTRLEGHEELERRFVQSVPVEMRLDGLTPEQRLAGLAPEQQLMGLTPEQRLAGLAPEQRLAGLAPEQWLAGVSEAEQLLALSPHLLQQLPDDYIASLPTDLQVRVRARRGR